MFSKRIVLFLFLYYNLTLFLYTSYGVYKSYGEYFCKYKRADTADYRFIDEFMGVNVTTLEGENKVLVGLNDKIGVMVPFYPNNSNMGYALGYVFVNFTQVADGYYTKRYQTEGGYMDLNCTISGKGHSEHVTSNGSYSTRATDSITLALNGGNVRMLGDLDGLGYLRKHIGNSGWDIGLPAGEYYLNSLQCSFLRSPETCNLPIEVSNLFFKVYIMLCLALLSTFMLTLLSYRRKLFLRTFCYAREFLSIVFKESKFFCNPITGMPVHFLPGEKMQILISRSEALNPSPDELSEVFHDSVGTYTIIGNSIICRVGNIGTKIILNGGSKLAISNYFYKALMNPKNCVVNSEGTHFLDTITVIKSINEGMKVVEIDVVEQTVGLDVKEFELEILQNLFIVKKSVAKGLLEHNWRFFGGKYSIQSLHNAMNGKCWSRDKPSQVKNSQWKWYTSDVSLFMNDYGFNIKGQVKWKPSPALIEVRKLDQSAIPVTPTVETVQFEKNDSVNFIKKMMLKEIVINADEAPPIKKDFKPTYSAALGNSPVFVDAVSQGEEAIKNFKKTRLDIMKQTDVNEILEKLFKCDSYVKDAANSYRNISADVLIGNAKLASKVKEGTAKQTEINLFNKGVKKAKEKHLPILMRSLNDLQEIRKDLKREITFFQGFEEQAEKLEEMLKKENQVYDEDGTVKCTLPTKLITDKIKEEMFVKSSKGSLRRSGRFMSKKGKNGKRLKKFLKLKHRRVKSAYNVDDMEDLILKSAGNVKSESTRCKNYITIRLLIKSIFHNQMGVNKINGFMWFLQYKRSDEVKNTVDCLFDKEEAAFIDEIKTDLSNSMI